MQKPWLKWVYAGLGLAVIIAASFLLAFRKDKPAGIPFLPLENQPAISAEEAIGEDVPEPEDAASEVRMGFVRSVYENDGKYYLTIDYVDWLDGREAVKALFEAGRCYLPEGMTKEEALQKISALEENSAGFDGCSLDNGYYIRNVNPKLRTFEIPQGLRIEYWSMGRPNPEADGAEIGYLSPDVLAKVFSGAVSEQSAVTSAISPKMNPYRITFKDGAIVNITIAYIP